MNRFCNKFFFLSLFPIFSLFSFGELPQQAPMLFEKGRSQAHIRMNNRVLAIVNQKPITLLDVVKEMDLIFYKQYPQYASVPELRFQFYTMSWQSALQELVEKELILADAAEVKLEIPGTDLRQEVKEVFGPNVILSLDEAGLTLDETMKMIENDMILRRMMYIRVQSKAIKDVTPSEIRAAYERFCANYHLDNKWHFQVITIRDPDSYKLKQIASKFEEVVMSESINVEDVNARIKRFSETGVFTSVKVSDPFEQSEEDLSPKYKEILSSLKPGKYSAPQLQESNNVPTIKILYLNDIVYDEIPSFAKMSQRLKSELMMQIASRETDEYKKRLRKQYSVTLMDQLLSSDYEPFALMADGEKIELPTR